MRDVEDRHAHLFVQRINRFENCRPEGCVNHRNRLIGNDDFRLKQHGPRHDDALPLPATELVGISPEDLFWAQSDLTEGVAHLFAGFIAV